ncbi:uncharacterized protein METZ01_LOCUS423879 [marine metagenome]|uniref:Uncharacterized protein n=1 Tax=marine metagenome TaxID=408172 RepID=A0A382XK88_9ZZZZ
MNVKNRLDTTSPDYLKFIEETKQMDRKQETKNQMNKEREYVKKSVEIVNRSNLGTVVDVYA